VSEVHYVIILRTLTRAGVFRISSTLSLQP